MTHYNQSLERLQNILNELRSKCPWDKKQTIHSLRSNTIEELYELIDAIDQDDWSNIKEELGDLLLHILFYSKIADEQSQFSIQDVIEQICNKLVRRHPHIYENIIVNSVDDVKQNWEKIKLKEGKKSVLSGVPAALPALTKAYRLQDKAKQIGFDWEKRDDVKEKVYEELDELEIEIEQQNIDKIEAEFGDVLFSLINYARFLNIDPDKALTRTNEKFKKRFEFMEVYCSQHNIAIEHLSLQELDNIWNKAKLHFSN